MISFRLPMETTEVVDQQQLDNLNNVRYFENGGLVTNPLPANGEQLAEESLQRQHYSEQNFTEERNVENFVNEDEVRGSFPTNFKR